MRNNISEFITQQMVGPRTHKISIELGDEVYSRLIKIRGWLDQPTWEEFRREAMIADAAEFCIYEALKIIEKDLSH